jgi:hypothetical protein
MDDCLPKDLFKLILGWLCPAGVQALKLVCKRWKRLVEQLPSLDVAFVCDITGSCNWWIDTKDAIQLLCMHWSSLLHYRLSFIGYRDHIGGGEIIQSHPLTSLPLSVLNFVSKLYPEVTPLIRQSRQPAYFVSGRR